ncbi:MAG TPA: zinc metallopeptidase [Verrucomicrobia bacterium]|nr:zinc metallopeptidase [Verrucomicrobiota bacterium]HOB33551.1 zinc metallopeptidase [Verrucomicrobiota bacterium]HOP96887.1 zinc metallopeptidase [Verrucomicrobiota bacterium]HPU56593.1 zinc metallopeptidase [Verrucomicrobiota bacterium]
MWYDPYYWLFIIPGILLGLYAQVKLSSTYNKYVRVGTQSGITGAEAAREILDRAGLYDMPVREVGGHLTDHYDPIKKALYLSSENFHGRSLAAVGVAAHEAGHALQHKEAYAPLNLRMAMVPITQFASMAWMGIVVLGIVLNMFSTFIWIAIAIFAILTFFQLVTLPVEFDASRRAKEQLLRLGLVHPHESGAVSKVLNAAALTYVAALVTAVLQLAHLLFLARGRD